MQNTERGPEGSSGTQDSIPTLGQGTPITSLVYLTFDSNYKIIKTISKY